MIFPRSSPSCRPIPRPPAREPGVTLIWRYSTVSGEDDIADSARRGDPFIFHRDPSAIYRVKMEKGKRGGGASGAPFSRDGKIMSLKYISGIIVWFMFMTSCAIFASSAKKEYRSPE